MIPFHAFGPAHLAVLAAVPALAVLLAGSQRRAPSSGPAISRTLATLLLVNCAAYYASFALAGEPLFPGHLPLELCDVSVLVAAAALVSRRQAIFDVMYYWALAGAGNALFTPNFTQASWFIWVQYFVSHGLIVVSALYLVWSRRARPRPGSIGRVFLITNGYAVLVGTFDWIFGTNYMYLRHRPPAPTLLDLLGPWPWYIVLCEGLALGLFVLLYLPFRRPVALAPDTASVAEPAQSFQ
jgi:hypothetical integral membrane protein (TIGR02206 family)